MEKGCTLQNIWISSQRNAKMVGINKNGRQDTSGQRPELAMLAYDNRALCFFFSKRLSHHYKLSGHDILLNSI